MPYNTPSYTPPPSQRVQLNDWTPNGSPLQLLYLAQPPSGAGTVTYLPDGTFNYLPTPNFFGAWASA